MATNKAKKGGNKVQSRQALYSKAAVHAPRAIEVLVDLMNNGDNDNVKMGAAKVILQKSIPDLKAMEVSGENITPVIIKLDGSPTISTKATRSLGSAEE